MLGQVGGEGGDLHVGHHVTKALHFHLGPLVLAYLDVPTLGQPEAFIHAKEGLFGMAEISVQTVRHSCKAGWINMLRG